MSTAASGDEYYDGPPPTQPPPPGQWQPAPWQPPPWQPAPWQPAPWQPPPWQPGPSQPVPWSEGQWPPPPPWGPAWGPPPWAPVPAPYAMRWPPPGTPPHDEPRPFLHAMRSRTWRWWRPMVGLLLFSVVYAVAGAVTFLVGIVALVAVPAAAGSGFSEQNLDDASGPGFLLLINLVTAVAIPVVWLAWVAVHRMGIGWSSSVVGRLRWRLFPSFTVFALATIGVSLCLSLALGVAGGWEVTGPVASYGWLLVVVLLTTPLQSAAEEYLFRGYLSQAVAGWVPAPLAGAVVAAMVTATLFSLVHLPPDLLTFFQRFLVGLAASAVVWLTGGLEAAIALHTVNNVVIFVVAGGLGGDLGTSTGAEGGVPWLDALLTLVALVTFVALVARSRRRLWPETRTPALDLRVPRPVLVPAG